MNDPGEIILFQTEDGQTRIDVRLVGETVWLSATQISDLFQRDKSVILKHIKNVFAEGELKPEATVANFATVQIEGEREVTRDIEHYSLDVIISVGYRVKSHRGVQFRVWATQQLRDYLVKGFVLNDEKFKQGKTPKAQVPFVRLLLEECGKARTLDDAQTKKLIGLAIEVVERVQQEIRKIGFWKNDTMREQLTKALVRDLDQSGLCPPKKEREIAQRLVALAKENHEYLSKT